MTGSALGVDRAATAGAWLARFHAAASRHPAGVDYARRVECNLEGLLPLLAPGRRQGLKRFASAFLAGSAGVLQARATQGMVRDGHGDRQVLDVADDLALLLVELADRTGTGAAGDAALVGYLGAGGPPPPAGLLAFFGTYRAQAEARAELVRAVEPGGDGPSARAHALRLLALSRRLTWRARGRLVLLVTGTSEADASALVEGLGAVSGIPVLTADVHVLDRATGIMELADRVRAEGAAIVGAGAGDERRQGALAALLADGGSTQPLLVECRVPPVGGDTLAKLDAVAGVRAGDHLVLSASESLASRVDAVESWLDSLMAAGREG